MTIRSNPSSRRRPASTTVVAIACAATFAMLSACTSTGPKRIEATTSSMRDTKAMLDDGRKQVAAVMAAARAVESRQRINMQSP